MPYLLIKTGLRELINILKSFILSMIELVEDRRQKKEEKKTKAAPCFEIYSRKLIEDALLEASKNDSFGDLTGDMIHYVSQYSEHLQIAQES